MLALSWDRTVRGAVETMSEPSFLLSDDSPILYSVTDVLRGERFDALSGEENALFAATAHWLDTAISRPNAAVGRAGDVCPWTRRTLQLNRLFLAAIRDTAASSLDAAMVSLLCRFQGLATADARDTFRAIVAVFPGVSGAAGAQLVVETHRRLKPMFLGNRMMLGEFYPNCPKPGLRNPSFRPLEAPHPLLVIRAMVEADLLFLTDQDEFVAAYLAAFGERGRANVLQLLQSSSQLLDADCERRLRQQVGLV